jgi:hypothetical protein
MTWPNAARQARLAAYVARPTESKTTSAPRPPVAARTRLGEVVAVQERLRAEAAHDRRLLVGRHAAKDAGASPPRRRVVGQGSSLDEATFRNILDPDGPEVRRRAVASQTRNKGTA